MKFLADSMLGSLGRWLRLLGYDAATASDEPDAQLVRQARAEGRVLLTRDRALARRQGVQTLLIDSGDLDSQLVQVARTLHLPAPQPGTRCPHCNGPLRNATGDEVANLVPPYVLRTQDCFGLCPTCCRVYWQGTHWLGMAEKVRLVNESGATSYDN